jgi:hypothetical protein
MWKRQKYSVESWNLQSESPTFQSHSVTSQFSLIMLTWHDTVVWNRKKYASTLTWQLRNQCAMWSVCCRSHRHVRLKTQLLLCLLVVTNKTRAAGTVNCTSCRQSTFIPMILHDFPAFCDFRVSHIGAAGHSSLVGGYAVTTGIHRSYCLHLQGQHEETTIIWKSVIIASRHGKTS